MNRWWRSRFCCRRFGSWSFEKSARNRRRRRRKRFHRYFQWREAIITDHLTRTSNLASKISTLNLPTLEKLIWYHEKKQSGCCNMLAPSSKSFLKFYLGVINIFFFFDKLHFLKKYSLKVTDKTKRSKFGIENINSEFAFANPSANLQEIWKSYLKVKWV